MLKSILISSPIALCFVVMLTITAYKFNEFEDVKPHEYVDKMLNIKYWRNNLICELPNIPSDAALLLNNINNNPSKQEINNAVEAFVERKKILANCTDISISLLKSKVDSTFRSKLAQKGLNCLLGNWGYENDLFFQRLPSIQSATDSYIDQYTTNVVEYYQNNSPCK